MTAPDIHKTVDAIWRIESARLIVGLARITGDVGTAEELAQDALVAALEQWPRDGIPNKPGAWLMGTAKHRAIDAVRRKRRLATKHDQIRREQAIDGEGAMPDLDATLDDDVGDGLLRLIFIACHPVLSREARVAMTLRLLGGLTTVEIARAFLAPEPTIAQRIVRAKRALSDAKARFEMPEVKDRAERLSSVLEVIYLIFNEGYSATAGDDWLRPALCEDALSLGRVLATLSPAEPEVHGLVALMELQASRFHARIDAAGEPILLLDQNRARWDQLLIHRGLDALKRAESQGDPPGPYTLQAAIAACHARATTAESTDWLRIARLYEMLGLVTPSPVIELNHAVAVGMALGPQAGLNLVAGLGDNAALKTYPLLPSVRGYFLARLGRKDEARGEFERAAALTKNQREKAIMLRHASSCS